MTPISIDHTWQYQSFVGSIGKWTHKKVLGHLWMFTRNRIASFCFAYNFAKKTIYQEEEIWNWSISWIPKVDPWPSIMFKATSFLNGPIQDEGFLPSKIWMEPFNFMGQPNRLGSINALNLGMFYMMVLLMDQNHFWKQGNPYNYYFILK